MLVFGLLCVAVFSTLTHGQGQRPGFRPRPWSNRARSSRHFNPRLAYARRGRPPINNQNRANESLPPQSWRDLIRMNGDLHGVNDFINLLVTADGRRVLDSDIFSPHETRDGKRVITGGGVLATSDECSPRNMSVRLPLDYTDSQVAYYPECTMVQRCGGCTPTPFLTCEPRYKEKIVYKVLRARYLYPGAMSMRWEGFTSVEVERHLSCRAVCNLQPQDCAPNQRFNSYQCKCQCMRSSRRCVNGKVWDARTCMCRCANQRPCCAEEGDEDDRTCISYFDHDFCECTLKTSIGASPNASQAEIEAWLESRRTTDNNPITLPTTTTPRPCGCPPNFVEIERGGRCFCMHRSAAARRRHGRG